jgi:hypothetical protein
VQPVKFDSLDELHGKTFYLLWWAWKQLLVASTIYCDIVAVVVFLGKTEGISKQ